MVNRRRRGGEQPFCAIRSIGASRAIAVRSAGNTEPDVGRPADGQRWRSADAAALDAVMAQTQVTALATHYTAPIGYTPAQIAAAYGFNSIKFGNVVGNGAGQTIAIVDAYDDPDIAGDLQTFDKQFGLAAPKFTEVKQLPTVRDRWSAPAGRWKSRSTSNRLTLAPGENIELVEAYTPSLGNLLSCVQYAAGLPQPGVSVVSMSWGSNEFSSETSYNSSFTTPSGHPESPSSPPPEQRRRGSLAGDFDQCPLGGRHLADAQQEWDLRQRNGLVGQRRRAEPIPVGGELRKRSANHRQTDGSRRVVRRQSQHGFRCLRLGDLRRQQWLGRSRRHQRRAPQWSALVAIANQGRVINHENTLTNAAAAVFTLSANDFHDVTSGSDGGHSAGKGYDEVTGLGTPQANLVAQGLLNVTAAQQTYTSVAASSSSVKAASSVTSKFDLAGLATPRVDSSPELSSRRPRPASL